jgi:hypothetical protein
VIGADPIDAPGGPPARIAAADLVALADQLLVDAIEVELALRAALLVTDDGRGIGRAFVTPRAKAAQLLHEAAGQLRKIPNLDAAEIAWQLPDEAPAPRRRVGRPRKPRAIVSE